MIDPAKIAAAVQAAHPMPTWERLNAREREVVWRHARSKGVPGVPSSLDEWESATPQQLAAVRTHYSDQRSAERERIDNNAAAAQIESAARGGRQIGR